eukprot:TRINITY_DN49035_c0_g1_i1.p1 TRINITY_DN49035_c0_g1~~TRINITY_DN49035_c0_g1_i1.p1  ORF type:complete len:296 (+),score=142.80 TRINITY_DN49035_c0_g1_i1:32-889(+)
MSSNVEVHMKHPEEVQKKIDALKEGGGDKLKVIADFDFTLTRFWWEEGERACSCYKVLEDCGMLDESYHDKAQELQRKFYPIEVCPDIAKEKKIEAMLEWVSQANKLLEDTGLREDMIPQIVKGAKVCLREKAKEVIDKLAECDVPLLVFSGGIANVLEEIFKKEGVVLQESAHIVSNRMVFGEDGTIASWTEPRFHAFNKDAETIKDEPFVKHESHRTNILLFGDSLGDVRMSTGLDVSTILTIGFLNDKVPERIDTYLDTYDVVILGDPSMSYHYDLLTDILN